MFIGQEVYIDSLGEPMGILWEFRYTWAFLSSEIFESFSVCLWSLSALQKSNSDIPCDRILQYD